MNDQFDFSSEMTEDEKRNYPFHKVCDGYLKKYEYKEAWQNAFKKADKETIKKIKKLKNFSSKVFFEITGVKI